MTTYTDFACKKSADYLRGYLQIFHKFHLKSSLAHDLVANVLGYKSNNARKVLSNKEDYHNILDPEYPDSFTGLEDSFPSVRCRINKLGKKNPELLRLNPVEITKAITDGLKPPCGYCGKEFNSVSVRGREESPGPEYPLWVCIDCSDHPDHTDLAICSLCPYPENVYDESCIGSDGLCKDIHSGEFDLDEDQISLAEYFISR